MNFTLKGMAAAAFRYKSSIILLTLYLGVAFALYFLFTKKMYTSTAEILVQAGQEQLAGPEIQNEIRILTSADTLMSAARAIAGPDAPEADCLRLRDYLQANLAVSGLADSDIVSARFSFPEPAAARDVLALIIKEFQSRRSAVYFSAGELEIAKNNVASAHAEYTAALEGLTDFESESRLYDGAQILELASNLESRRAQLASLRNDYVYTKVKLERMQETLGTLPKNVLFLVRESHNGLRDDFKGKLSNLALEKERLLARYQEDYSSVTEVQKEIDNLTELIDSEPERRVNEKETRPNDSYQAVHNAVLALGPEVGAMAERISHLEAQIAAEEEALVRANKNKSAHAVLSRDVELKKNIYDRVYQDCAAAAGRQGARSGSITNASVIAQPSLNPVPVRPNIRLCLAVAAAAFLVGNILILGLRAVTDSTISTPEDAERVLGLPVVGVFAALSRAGLDEAVPVPGAAAFERQKKNFRRLYLRVAADERPAAILFTSGMAGPDALSLAYNFAAFAREYQRRTVAVVRYTAEESRAPSGSADPARAPAAERTFRGVDEFVRPDDMDIVAGKRFLEEVKARYNLVLINYEPLQESPILITLAGELDRVVYRVSAGSTDRFQASHAIESLKFFGFGDISLAVTERKNPVPACLSRFL